MGDHGLLHTLLQAEVNQYRISNDILDCQNTGNLFDIQDTYEKPHSQPTINSICLNGECGANGLHLCNILWRRSLIFDHLEFNMRLQDCTYPIGTNDITFLSSRSIDEILKLTGQTQPCVENEKVLLSEFLKPVACASEDYNVSSRPTTVQKFIKYFTPAGIVVGKRDPENQFAIWDSVDSHSCNLLINGPLSAICSKTPGMCPSFASCPSPRLIIPNDKLDIDNCSSSRVFLYVVIRTSLKSAPECKSIPILHKTQTSVNFYFSGHEITYCLSSRGIHAIMERYIEDLKSCLRSTESKHGKLAEVACFRFGFIPSFNCSSLRAENSDNYVFENFNVCLYGDWKYKSFLARDRVD